MRSRGERCGYRAQWTQRLPCAKDVSRAAIHQAQGVVEELIMRWMIIRRVTRQFTRRSFPAECGGIGAAYSSVHVEEAVAQG